METKNKPGNFDCYANAEPDEPMFVLLARDELAEQAVRDWAGAYERKLMRMQPTGGSATQRAKLAEVYACIVAMREWRKANRP